MPSFRFGPGGVFCEILFFKVFSSPRARVAHLHAVQPLLQRLQHPLHLLRGRRHVPLRHVFVLPLAVAAVAYRSLPPHGWVVG